MTTSFSTKKEQEASTIFDTPFWIILMYFVSLKTCINRGILKRKLDLSIKGYLGSKTICKTWNSERNWTKTVESETQRLSFGDIIKGGLTGFSGSTPSKFEHNYVTINEGLENLPTQLY